MTATTIQFCLWTGSRDALSLVACNDDAVGLTSRVRFNAITGVTYYFMVGALGSGGDLVVTIEEVLPPPNDDFADATVIPEVPFSDPLDLAAATVETGEPIASCFLPPVGTAWYAFTPTDTQSYFGNLTSNTGFSFSFEYGVYTGSSLGNLIELVCHYGNPVLFHATAGTTYYIQIAKEGGGQVSPAQFMLNVAPPPVVNFFFYPSDPSTFDTINFYDLSYDPVVSGIIQTESWNFGDGGTATGCCPTHQFAAEGDYTVQLTVMTEDGRSASIFAVVSVRTHDIAITKFVVPTAANSGQTRIITVGVNSKRYRETVQVQLFKSNPTGYQLVGTLEQSVPVRPANRTTNFNFSYTFARSDANIGKVTFKAVATINGARDALPADNEAISLPTKVTR